MSDAAETRAPRNAAALIAAAGFAAMLILNLPGQMSYDSVLQLWDARRGTYNSWHPAAMDWLLGVADAALPGTALFVFLQAGLLALALWLLLARGARWAACPVILLLVLTPQFLLYQGIVWKDVLLADAALAAFAALAAQGPARRAWLIVFALAITLAGLMRPNALLFLPAGAAALGWIRYREGARHPFREALLAFGLLAALAASTQLLLARRGDGGEGMGDELRLAQTYDLTGAARLGFPLKRLARQDAPLARRIAHQGIAAWSPRLMDTLEPVLGQAVHDAPTGAIAGQWRDLVLTDPALYLRVRARIFWEVLATPDVAQCHPAFAGVEGPPQLVAALHLTPGLRPSDRWLAAYTRGFMGTPVLSHLLFGALALLLMLLHGRRGGSRATAMIGLLAGALLYTASFFIVSVACDYRYLYVLDMSAMLAAFAFFTDTPSNRKNLPR